MTLKKHGGLGFVERGHSIFPRSASVRRSVVIRDPDFVARLPNTIRHSARSIFSQGLA